MPTDKLSNIHNDLDGYNQLVQLYEEHKDDIFEKIDIELQVWFDANLSALLGGILDKIKNGDNYIQKIHQGYNCDYEPMRELLKSKIEEIMNG